MIQKPLISLVLKQKTLKTLILLCLISLIALKFIDMFEHSFNILNLCLLIVKIDLIENLIVPLDVLLLLGGINHKVGVGNF